MTILMILPLLFGNFAQKWYIPQGIYWGAGRIVIEDSDRDGNYEFYMTTYGGSQKIYIYELHLPDTWEVDSFAYLYSPLIWDIGDYDLDGHWDLAIQASATQGYPTMVISVAESPDSFSYPVQEVWRDTVGFPLVTPICVYDIDQDGLDEIAKVCGYYTDLEIYEAVGNNTYGHIATVITPSTHTASSTIAFGDFDSDNQNEFVWGYSGGEYSIWECIGNNSYQEVLLQQLPTVNIIDCFTVPDADGDGKLEFVVKGYVVPTARINAFIFEATGDNTYEIVKSFDLFGGHNSYYGGYSDVGDMDGDSIPEIALEGCQNIYIIKAANDSFYVWEILPGNTSGSSVRVYDIDGNGRCEVVISGNNQTRIYEYEVGVAEDTKSKIPLETLRIHPNPFRTQTQIRYMTEPNQKSQLKIYDTTGRLVKIFHPESSIQNPGSEVIWDGTDNHGIPLPAGVYFVQIQSSSGEQSVPVVLLR